MKSFIAAFFWVIISANSYSQDTLPRFSARFLTKERVQISWKNPHKNCVQLSVQRSYDSLRFFKSIFSAQSPELPQNGYIDNTPAPGMKVYYRIFYVLEGGSYFFSKSKQPDSIGYKPIKPTQIKKHDTAAIHIINNIKHPVIDTTEEPEDTVVIPPPPPPIHWVSIYKKSKDSLFTKINIDFYKKFKDSIRTKTKDTLVSVGIDEYLIKPFVPIPVWKPSKYLFTNTDGYTILKVPDLAKHRYRIVITEENGTEIFTINNVNDEYLMIDKSNFPHAGWFFYTMYEDGKLFEKNKFFIESDL